MVCLDPAKAKELYGLDAEEIQKGDRIRFMDSIKVVDKYLVSPEVKQKPIQYLQKITTFLQVA